MARKWKAEDVTGEIISTLEHGDIIGQAQTGMLGLGSGNFRPVRNPSQQEGRTAATR